MAQIPSSSNNMYNEAFMKIGENGIKFYNN